MDIEHFDELGAANGAKIEKLEKIDQVKNPDILMLLGLFQSQSLGDAYQWVFLHQKELGPRSFILDMKKPQDLLQYKHKHPDFLFFIRKANKIYELNKFLFAANEVLTDEGPGYIWMHVRTSTLDKEIIKAKYWPGINKLAYLGYYLWHRVAPKLKGIKKLYFWKTKGRNRSFSRVEILGRLCRAGFDIVDERFLHGELFVLAKKARKPITDREPSCGPIIKLPRVGKDGALIGVYKFRTMYSYSEYIQGYIYEHEGLQKGGKFNNDYRINTVGRIMRRTWIDELPMLYNWIVKHNIKLVGVRPLSRQYFSLYSPQMQQLRIKTKPGLIPPFYYDRHTPEDIEQVQQSERRYLEAYLQHPFRTDMRYFWGTVGNIIFRHKRSK